MQSYTTQAHQRNYQGNVILPNKFNVTKRKATRGIAVWILALTVAITSSLLGVVTLHNQQLKHRIQALETQSTAVTAPTTTNNKPTRRGKTLPSVPISEQQHETENLPLLNQH